MLATVRSAIAYFNAQSLSLFARTTLPISFGAIEGTDATAVVSDSASNVSRWGNAIPSNAGSSAGRYDERLYFVITTFCLFRPTSILREIVLWIWSTNDKIIYLLAVRWSPLDAAPYRVLRVKPIWNSLSRLTKATTSKQSYKFYRCRPRWGIDRRVASFPDFVIVILHPNSVRNKRRIDHAVSDHFVVMVCVIFVIYLFLSVLLNFILCIFCVLLGFHQMMTITSRHRKNRFQNSPTSCFAS